MIITVLTNIFSGYSQNSYFANAEQLLLDEGNGRAKLIYFHFEGCKPCAKMSETVLNDSAVINVLINNYDCYSIFGFNKLEKKIREKYSSRGNPAFVFIDTNGVKKHAFVGFYKKEDFISMALNAFKGKNTYYMDSVYNSGVFSQEFHLEYIQFREKIFQLDSSAIFKYFSTIDSVDFYKKDNFLNLMNYGYHKANTYVTWKSKYYNIIKYAYNQKLFEDQKENMRVRLIYPIMSKLYDYKVDNNNLKQINLLLNKLQVYENGSPILLKDIYNNNIFGFIDSKNPSFEYSYDSLYVNFPKKRTTYFKEYIQKISNDHKELNSIAWGIYKGSFTESPELGIEIILQALNMANKYNYLDTYAALLFKSKNYKKAFQIAEEAIKLGKEKQIDVSSTESLIKDYLGEN
ncbi:MAG: hypothetical protein V3V14_11000 [Saprospiraceae bacterium]